MRILLLSLAGCLLLTDCARGGDNWPQFLGPHGNGHADAEHVPLTWSETEHVKWKVPVHDRGWSSPVIWGRQIWVTTGTLEGHKLYALCFDAETGEVEHDIHLFDVAEPRDIQKYNTFASCTPVIEEGRVYVHYGSYGTACLDTASGEVLWQRRDLPCNHYRGPGSSPILYDGKLIIHFDGYDYQYVVALDKETGKTVWKSDRDIEYGTDNGDYKKAFCTPLVINVDGRDQLISPAAKAAVAYDPQTGAELWKVRYREHSASAKPVFGDGLVFISSGFGKASYYAVRTGGSGDVTESHVAWSSPKSIPSKPTPLLIDGRLYMIHDQGVASCLEAATGEVVWSGRVRGNYSSSPLYAGGRIYFFSHEGKSTVIDAGPEFRILAENDLDGAFYASPAVYGDDLILRTETHLYRIGE